MEQLEFGRYLADLREKSGYRSQRQLSLASGVSNGTIARIESGSQKPQPDTLLVLSKFLKDVTYQELMKAAGYLPHLLDQIDTFVEYRANKETEKLKSGSKEEIEFYEVGNLRQIPIVAEIPCGTPIFTEENIIGSQSVDTSFVKLNGGEYVWVKAKGNSMIEAGITDGSLVLIRLQPEVESGEIAAVCVDQENATLKRVMFADGVVILMPANPDMKPQSYLAERIRIVGKVMKILTDPK